ncbi:MAG: BatD family protein [Myxococcales bacterium]|nr:BatD family protein [Myxococcales bacterium]MDH3483837.1 BatD family protein [Myxococcales bacterium]
MIRPLTFVCLVAIGALAHGASARADAEAEVILSATPREIRVGETFSLEVRANVKGGSLEDLTFADLKKHPELDIVSHQTARPMQVSFGFGSGMKVQSSLSHQYTMRALSAGTFEFSPAVAKVEGKTYRSDPLTIIVLPADNAATIGPATPTPPLELGEELSGARYDPRAFLRTVVEQEEVYIGQQVNVAVYLYTHVGVAGRSVNPTKPAMDGFWVYDEQITSLEGPIVQVNGVQYRAYVLQKSAAFPQRTGELTIGAPKVTFDIGTMSLFDAPERVERTGVPVTVNVKPLPTPGPSDAFVGKYSVRARLDRGSVNTGNAVTLRVDATGVGNIQDLRIELPPIAGVRILQPVIRDEQRFYGKALGGTRSWEWILIPKAPGQHTVPGIELDYFDPVSQRYGSASTQALTFSATGVATPAQPMVSPMEVAPKQAAAVFGPIRMYSALTRETTPITQRPWFAWLVVLPPLVFIVLTIGVSIARRHRRRRATAGAVQRALIDEAQQALRDDDPRAFYDRIVATITHALVTQTAEPVRGLSNAELRPRLVAAGFDDDLVQRVINELEGADFARFAASGVDTEEMQRCLQRTETMVERIQRVRGKA